MTDNNPVQDLVNINAYTKFCVICPFVRKQNSDINLQTYTAITYKQKRTGNNPKLDLVNVNAYIIQKFGKILSIC